MQRWPFKLKKWAILMVMLLVGVGVISARWVTNQGQPISLLSDPYKMLDSASFERIQSFLQETAATREVYISIFLLREDPIRPFTEIAQGEIKNFEQSYPHLKKKERKANLFVNVSTNTSFIMMEEDLLLQNGLKEGIHAIYQEVLSPQLANNQIDKGLWDTAIALAMALENFHSPILVAQESYLTKMLLLILGAALLLYASKRFFYRPHWEETLNQSLFASLPDNLSLGEMTSMLIAMRKDSEINGN